MKIFIISETLTAGGAEWFSLRLANALQEKGNQVYFFVLRPDKIIDQLKNKFPQLTIITLPETPIRWLVQIDRVVKKLTGKYRLVEWANVKMLNRYVKEFSPDVIHGHLIESDLVAIKANNAKEAHNVTTIHGDYIAAIKNNLRLSEINLLLNKLNAIAIISDEQQKIISTYAPHASSKLRKIYNGYPLPNKTFDQPDDSLFCFGMIARAIPEKGWKQLIEAFSMIENEHIRLILFGEGAYLDELKNQNKDSRIIFAGFSDDPLKSISTLHVGLLPSYYDSESLPTTIIEYLALEKPVIATNVGEVKNMLKDEHGNDAGILLQETNPEKMVKPLHEALKKMLDDKAFYQSKKTICKAAFEKFSMEKCIEAYMQLYQK